MFQGAINALEKLPGVVVTKANLFEGDRAMAGLAIEGCRWDDVGNLVLANVGNEE